MAVTPGPCDTAMQEVLRTKGAGVMDDKDHATFLQAHEGGGLIHPDLPGGVIAKLVLSATPDLTGQFLRYVSSRGTGQQEWTGPDMLAAQLGGPRAGGFPRG